MPDAEAVRSALEAVHGHADRLENVLQDERTALSGDDLDALDRSAAAKLQAAQELADARAELFRLSGAQDIAGVHAWLDRLETNWPLLAELRARVREALTRCDKANATNGRIIVAGRAQAETALDLLMGDAGGRAMTTYDMHGGQDRGPRNPTLESA